MLLSKLINGLKVEYIYGNENINIEGISYDSRKVERNHIFICIQGLKTDGHSYIKSAINKGAIAVVIDREIDELGIDVNNITVIKVTDGRMGLSKISSNYYNNPTKKINVVGVTGTNGKTSITYLLNTILESNKEKCSIIGTIKNKLGKKVYKTNNTTPESLELQSLFDKMIKESIDTCLMEVSSHSLDLKRVEDVAFNIGIFTNLTGDHLDYHHNMESYKNAKIKLFYKTKDANIINIDDEYGKEIYRELSRLETPLLSYGTSCDCDIFARNIQMFDSYSVFELVTPKYEGVIKIKIPGLFSIYNILAAISACYILGYDYEDIVKGIELIKPVRGRFELIENSKGISVIVDYAHTPDALINVLKTIKDFVKGKIITVFGCGGDRDKSKRPIMGEIACRYSDQCIITNDNPRSEDPKTITDDIIKGIEKNYNNFQVILDRRKAIGNAIAMSEKNDVILIAGKGHETYQIINNKTYDFDDREVALEFLEEEGYVNN